MFFTPTIYIAKLLATMQVLMTLDMPLSTTMALPVTSKPIESTVENMAWQAWIELPPEQKQQVKSRKVTPKSIFTLPLRVECPAGHKQVDTKCIPVVIGTNDVLIDLNALGLLVGNTPTEDIYDYDDMGEEMADPLPFAAEMPVGEAEESGDGLTVELQPPSKDGPLKFNIFESKFHIFNEEPLEDYSSISNEGLLGSSEKEQNLTVSTPPQPSEESTSSAKITDVDDLLREASNNSKNSLGFYTQQQRNSSASDSEAEESNPHTTLSDNVQEFKIDAISVPVSGFEVTKDNKLPVIQNDSSITMVTSMMDPESTTVTDEQDKQTENDIQTLLKTESLLPLLNHTTVTTFLNSLDNETFSLTTLPLREPGANSFDILNLNIDEEITTLANAMEHDVEVKTKQEHTRSVTMNPLTDQNNESGDIEDNGDNDLKKDSTLEILTNDELLETTTPIQLDETTIIETHSSLSTTSSAEQELKELLLQQEHAANDFEELQRVRKGQKYQHVVVVVVKKSKVQPVEVLNTTAIKTTTATEATTKTTKSATASASLPPTTAAAATTSVDEFVAATAETVTPLLTVHNENDNNDRFYYHQFGKQENEVTLRSELTQKAATTTAKTAQTSPTIAATGRTTTATISTKTETIPTSTSEIDLAEELGLINELVKGIRPATTLTAMPAMQTTATTTTPPTTSRFTTTTTTTTVTVAANTEKPSLSTEKIIFTHNFQQNVSPNSVSESSPAAKKPTLSTSQIWSKLKPLLITSSTTSIPGKSSPNESLNESNHAEINAKQTADATPSSSLRSNRNSKIIRINGFNGIAAVKAQQTDTAAIDTEETTTTTTGDLIEESTTSSTTTTISSSSSSSSTSSATENNTYEPYWWLPAAWRLDKPTNSEKQPEVEPEVKSEEEESLLLRFWSAYAPKSR